MDLPADKQQNVSWLIIPLVFVAAALPAVNSGTMRAEVLVLTAALGLILAWASVIDWQSFILPDTLTLPLIPAGLIATLWLGAGSLPWHASSAIAGYGLLWCADQLYLRARGRHGLGMGDAKLLAAAGAWLGADALPTVLLWATGLALGAALLTAAGGRGLTAGTKLPFGPPLALGFWLTWLYGALA
jgi:leader peptidase (prepilin peptidase) / N-methyltransferase